MLGFLLAQGPAPASSASAPWWGGYALGGVFTLVAVVLTFTGTLIVERRKGASDAERALEATAREVYARFAGALHRDFQDVLEERGKARGWVEHAEPEEVRTGFAELQLVAPPAVAARAEAYWLIYLGFLTNYVPPTDPKVHSSQSTRGYHSARRAFVNAVRKQYGLGELPSTLEAVGSLVAEHLPPHETS